MDEILLMLFKLGEDSLIKALTSLNRGPWNEESIPMSWHESLVVLVFRKGIRNDCTNHREISLVPLVTNVLASVVLHRLKSVCKINIRE